MTDNETEIRGVIETWVAAIQTGDLAGVRANHTDDIVMFDVQPPFDGVRGAAAYRDTWPPFFEFIAGGATFELLELDVTTGDTVAYAHGLLRCGKPEDFAANPDNRLRMTMGLRKVNDRWQIAHEHHSFPMTD